MCCSQVSESAARGLNRAREQAAQSPHFVDDPRDVLPGMGYEVKFRLAGRSKIGRHVDVGTTITIATGADERVTRGVFTSLPGSPPRTR